MKLAFGEAQGAEPMAKNQNRNNLQSWRFLNENVDHFFRNAPDLLIPVKSAIGPLMAPHASPKRAHMSYVIRLAGPCRTWRCWTAPGGGKVHMELALSEAQGAEPMAKNQNR